MTTEATALKPKRPAKQTPTATIPTKHTFAAYGIIETPDGRWQALKLYIKEGSVIQVEPHVQDQPERDFAEDDLLKLLSQDGIR